MFVYAHLGDAVLSGRLNVAWDGLINKYIGSSGKVGRIN